MLCIFLRPQLVKLRTLFYERVHFHLQKTILSKPSITFEEKFAVMQTEALDVLRNDGHIIV